MSTDWCPGKRVDQLAMAKKWINVLRSPNPDAGPGQGAAVTMGDKWGVLQAVVEELEELVNKADTAFTTATSEETRTPVANARCKTAFDDLVAKMRDIKDRHFKQPPMEDADFISLGLKPKDTTKTIVPVPTGQAEADITHPGTDLVMLHIKLLTGTVIDPDSLNGYRIYYGIMPPGGATVEEATGHDRYLMKPALTGEDLPHSRFTRRKKETLIFSPLENGKTVYFSVRIENSKGEAGPWGPVFKAVIS